MNKYDMSTLKAMEMVKRKELRLQHPDRPEHEINAWAEQWMKYDPCLAELRSLCRIGFLENGESVQLPSFMDLLRHTNWSP